MPSLTEAFAVDYIRNGWRPVPIRRGEKRCTVTGWPELVIATEDVPRYFGNSANIGIVLGSRSRDLADIDLDCDEANSLADLYLPQTQSEFGRVSRPRAHRLYIAPGARYAAFADPAAAGQMMVELRADGSEAAAHCTTVPPSHHPSGETVTWHIQGDPRSISAAQLHTACAWLAIGCLVARYLSPSAATKPAPDFPQLLWEFDEELGRTALRWLGRPAPDEQRSRPQQPWSRRELDLKEVIDAIPNDCDWQAWNRIGMAIWNATHGSEIGRDLFDRFSAQNQKYQPAAVIERWKNYARSRPSRIGMGTLVHLAQQAGWGRPGR